MSDATVVAASRAFVCVRLASYESASEARFLERLFRGRSGALENTVFGLLAPDFKTKLVRFGRGPSWLVGERRGPDSRASRDAATNFAALLDRYAKRFKPKAPIRELPLSLDFRRALNVAACDGVPLLVLRANPGAKRDAARAKLAKLAWSERFVGRLQYAIVDHAKELKKVEGATAKEGFILLRAGQFGVDGKAIAQLALNASADKLSRLLRVASESEGNERLARRQHVRSGTRAGVEWDTEIPVTDPGSRDASRRRKRRRRR